MNLHLFRYIRIHGVKTNYFLTKLNTKLNHSTCSVKTNFVLNKRYMSQKGYTRIIQDYSVLKNKKFKTLSKKGKWKEAFDVLHEHAMVNHTLPPLSVIMEMLSDVKKRKAHSKFCDFLETFHNKLLTPVPFNELLSSIDLKEDWDVVCKIKHTMELIKVNPNSTTYQLILEATAWRGLTYKCRDLLFIMYDLNFAPTIPVFEKVYIYIYILISYDFFLIFND